MLSSAFEPHRQQFKVVPRFQFKNMADRALAYYRKPRVAPKLLRFARRAGAAEFRDGACRRGGKIRGPAIWPHGSNV